VVVALAVGAIVTGLVALLGLGYGLKQLERHVTGPGFNRKAHNARNRRYVAQLMNSEMLGEGDKVGTLSSKFNRGW